MEYNQINGFFDKFKKIIYQKQEVKKIITEVVSKNISFDLSDDFFVYKNGIINLRCSHVVRNEILMRKEKILKELKILLDKNTNVLDIK
jgi:hypothetical protein